jgi:hypothetical protein
MKSRRRDVLKMFAAATAGAALTPMITGSVRAAGGRETHPAVPWPYKKLDPERVAERGYTGFYRGACAYGTFEGIVGELREGVGFPYTIMPTEMMVFGEGGVAGVSSLCGTLIGASSAIFLVTGGMDSKRRGEAYAIIRELFTWYEQEALPNYRPKNPRFEIKTSAANSPLCHVSVTRWCEATGFKSSSKERDERCAWLVASVAKYTTELLNAKLDGAFKPAHALSAQVQSCRSCHAEGGAIEDSRGLMDCTACHFTSAEAKHP